MVMVYFIGLDPEPYVFFSLRIRLNNTWFWESTGTSTGLDNRSRPGADTLVVDDGLETLLLNPSCLRARPSSFILCYFLFVFLLAILLLKDLVRVGVEMEGAKDLAPSMVSIEMCSRLQTDRSNVQTKKWGFDVVLKICVYSARTEKNTRLKCRWSKLYTSRPLLI